jgi:phosphohistidine phosphatase SixA
MKHFISSTAFALGAVALLAAACSQPSSPPSREAEANNGTTLYLVRHAEKREGDDPALTEAGEARAETLADQLEGAGLDTIWSTDYRRTLATAAPLAQRLDVEVQIYDPGDLAGFAETLKSSGETALIVGHSNTTPQLSALLGGEAGGPIDEAGEYDRLYVLTGVGTGTIETGVERFGMPYDDTAD